MAAHAVEDWTALHGRPQAPEPLRPLRAGTLDAALDGRDLRYVRVGAVEAVRRIYVAVRDHNWITIPGEVSDLRVDAAEDGFDVTFACRHRRGDVDFAWEGMLRGSPDGEIVATMEGEARTDFAYNRIGFCVLHPWREMLDAPYRGSGPGGPVAGRFPDLIAPQRFQDGRYLALFDPVDALAVDLPGGGTLELAFAGDVFECEDQRNWTDASHKTYCTPLAIPYPHQARAGQRFAQSVTLRTTGAPARRPASDGGTVTLAVGAPTGRRLGPLGLGAATHGEPLGDRAAARLRALAPAHLRCDVRLADAAEPAPEVLAAREALGCPLELAVHLVEDDAPRLGALAGALRGIPVARVLVFAADAASPGPRESTPPGLAGLVREHLGDALGGAPVGGGTDLNFCELNRTRPSGGLDVLAYPVVAEVHAFDERSIVETLAAQAETVRSALAFAGERPVAVSPVTLRPRFNANATGPETAPDPDELPASVDVRQASLFAAAWTVGSVGRLAAAGAASLTFYETTGRRGVLARADDAGEPGSFPGRPGTAFPVYHVLTDLARRGGDAVLEAVASDELALCGLALQGEHGRLVLIASLAPDPRSVRVTGLPDGPGALRRLDASTVADATGAPEAFRAAEEPVEIRGGALALELGPYAVVSLTLPHPTPGGPA